MITIDWPARIINVPLADLTLVSGLRYTYSVEQFRLELRDLEDSDEGMNYPITHNRNAPVTLSGVTYAQVFQIINGYTVTFEAGSYTVILSGANHNIGDVQNVNGVSLVIGNSAGLVLVSGGSGPTVEEIADAILARSIAGGANGGRTIQDALRANRNRTVLSGGTLTVYEEDDTTVAWTATVSTGARDPVTGIDPA